MLNMVYQRRKYKKLQRHHQPSSLLGHRPPLWITHKESEPQPHHPPHSFNIFQNQIDDSRKHREVCEYASNVKFEAIFGVIDIWSQRLIIKIKNLAMLR
jgi:hypothetical protein